MSFAYTLELTGDTCTLHLNGTLYFTDHADFKPILRLAQNKNLKTIRLNLQHLTSINGAGLGMLLLLLEEAQKSGISLILSQAHGQVAKIITITKFHEIFLIE